MSKLSLCQQASIVSPRQEFQVDSEASQSGVITIKLHNRVELGNLKRQKAKEKSIHQKSSISLTNISIDDIDKFERQHKCTTQESFFPTPRCELPTSIFQKVRSKLVNLNSESMEVQQTKKCQKQRLQSGSNKSQKSRLSDPKIPQLRLLGQKRQQNRKETPKGIKMMKSPTMSSTINMRQESSFSFPRKGINLSFHNEAGQNQDSLSSIRERSGQQNLDRSALASERREESLIICDNSHEESYYWTKQNEELTAEQRQRRLRMRSQSHRILGSEGAQSDNTYFDNEQSEGIGFNSKMRGQQQKRQLKKHHQHCATEANLNCHYSDEKLDEPSTFFNESGEENLIQNKFKKGKPLFTKRSTFQESDSQTIWRRHDLILEPSVFQQDQDQDQDQEQEEFSGPYYTPKHISNCFSKGFSKQDTACQKATLTPKNHKFSGERVFSNTGFNYESQNGLRNQNRLEKTGKPGTQQVLSKNRSNSHHCESHRTVLDHVSSLATLFENGKNKDFYNYQTCSHEEPASFEIMSNGSLDKIDSSELSKLAKTDQSKDISHINLFDSRQRQAVLNNNNNEQLDDKDSSIVLYRTSPQDYICGTQKLIPQNLNEKEETQFVQILKKEWNLGKINEERGIVLVCQPKTGLLFSITEFSHETKLEEIIEQVSLYKAFKANYAEELEVVCGANSLQSPFLDIYYAAVHSECYMLIKEPITDYLQSFILQKLLKWKQENHKETLIRSLIRKIASDIELLLRRISNREISLPETVSLRDVVCCQDTLKFHSIPTNGPANDYKRREISNSLQVEIALIVESFECELTAFVQKNK